MSIHTSDLCDEKQEVDNEEPRAAKTRRTSLNTPDDRSKSAKLYNGVYTSYYSDYTAVLYGFSHDHKNLRTSYVRRTLLPRSDNDVGQVSAVS